ncbi:MAG: ribulose-phosphate 3-epimerase [Rhodobacteraceae bacterium]|nr:ribulose-phosphate 3-epimerase [Paracoccaceae bacterium]
MASVLTADFSALGAQCRSLEDAGIDGIHWDVMDGRAVPALSFGPDIIAACRRHVALPFEAHLMTSDPDPLIDQVADAGCDTIMIHPDWIRNPRRTLQTIVDRGLTAGVALSPGTSVDAARWHIDIIGCILIMTVEPGFGGQSNIELINEKIRQVAVLISASDRHVELEVDGGIGPDTIAGAHLAGARKFVVGSALWRSQSFAVAKQKLDDAIGAAYPSTKPV